MTTAENIAWQRLATQRLEGKKFASPTEVVQWLTAIQAQDYAGAKWAIGQRMHTATSADLDTAFNKGLILRTHVLRPTWHFVLPQDIRWMLELTAPRVKKIAASYERTLGLTPQVLARTNGIIANSLQGGSQLTRAEIGDALKAAGVEPGSGMRLGFIMLHAELTALVCSGALKGKQHTYALLKERAPQAKKLSRDAALAELARRFFTSHGPATPHDFANWSGLTIGDARRGLEMSAYDLKSQQLDSITYWNNKEAQPPKKFATKAHLLPNYDEYYIGYKNRSAIMDLSFNPYKTDKMGKIYAHNVIIGSQVVGAWRRTITKGHIIIQVQQFKPFTKAQKILLDAPAAAYGAFFGMPTELTFSFL